MVHASSVLAPLVGGALIGLSASLLLLLNGKVAGISGIFGGLLRPSKGDTQWRILFVAGLLLGGAILRVAYPAAVGGFPARGVAVALAGLLVGFGTSVANGCTSGHGICGVSRFAPRSILATLTFMAAGMGTVFVVQHVLGGAL